MVIGAERMREANNLETTDFGGHAHHPIAEYVHGVTLPSLAAMFTRLYMEKYGVTERHLAMVAVKNHDNALLNFFAHLHENHRGGILSFAGGVHQQPVRVGAAALLRLLPQSDGGARGDPGVGRVARKLGKPMVRLVAGQATDTHAVHEREDPTELARRAAGGPAVS